jgi:hypothetical protein
MVKPGSCIAYGYTLAMQGYADAVTRENSQGKRKPGKRLAYIIKEKMGKRH